LIPRGRAPPGEARQRSHVTTYGAGGTQTLPTQTWVPGHAVQAAVQCRVSVLEAQVLVAVQMWKLVLQVGTQAPPTQPTLAAFAGVAHGVQEVPQLLTLVLSRQVGAAAVPQRWNPGALQATPQASGVPSQVAIPLAGGATHGAQDAPQLVVRPFDTQVPLALLGQR
jgi:hypothetical protein